MTASNGLDTSQMKLFQSLTLLKLNVHPKKSKIFLTEVCGDKNFPLIKLMVYQR